MPRRRRRCGDARLGCPAWSRSIRETDHTPATTMHSAAGAEAREESGAATSSLVLACPCRDLCPFKECGSVVDETFFAMLSMFDRPFPLGQSVWAFVGLPRRISCRVPEKQRCTHYDTLLNGEGVEPSNTSLLPKTTNQSRGQVDRCSEPPSCTFCYISPPAAATAKQGAGPNCP